ncbi:hypothetical protein F2Q68_00013246 [Brassica cretica]|uniref:Uncharacterized protein n=1 Tax=Brassica cretica TaxID=69181 RepID=A0A8S9HQ97_BRACR|nr:hypothetical protein F2Q68_00013246 [Brassica cretica]
MSIAKDTLSNNEQPRRCTRPSYTPLLVSWRNLMRRWPGAALSDDEKCDDDQYQSFKCESYLGPAALLYANRQRSKIADSWIVRNGYESVYVQCFGLVVEPVDKVLIFQCVYAYLVVSCIDSARVKKAMPLMRRRVTEEGDEIDAEDGIVGEERTVVLRRTRRQDSSKMENTKEERKKERKRREKKI